MKKKMYMQYYLKQGIIIYKLAIEFGKSFCDFQIGWNFTLLKFTKSQARYNKLNYNIALNWITRLVNKDVYIVRDLAAVRWKKFFIWARLAAPYISLAEEPYSDTGMIDSIFTTFKHEKNLRNAVFEISLCPLTKPQDDLTNPWSIKFRETYLY